MYFIVGIVANAGVNDLERLFNINLDEEFDITIYDNGPGEVYLEYNAKGIRTIKNGYKGKQKSSIWMGGSHTDFDCSFVGDKRLRCQ